MTFLVLSFLTSLVLTLLVVRSADQHAHRSADHDLSGPQKFHATPVPRIGGVGILVSMVVCVAVAQATGRVEAPMLWLLLLCSLPAFLSGLAEDLTKAVSPRRRLVSTAVSAGLAVWVLDAVITRTAIPGIDWLVGFVPFAIALTVFVVTGVANAINIIDGFNGLASMCVLLMLLAVTYVAFQVGDTLVFSLALAGAGAVLGFFVWNYPLGLIFLGDGGAYFVGFMAAVVALLLLQRNPQVSPLFPLLACIYPVFETLFSMYRRKVIRGGSMGIPDGLHLHSLIYRRLLRWAIGRQDAAAMMKRNSRTAPYLWLLCMFAVVPAVLFWDDSRVLGGCIVLFAFAYVVLYVKIIRFKVPGWMVSKR